MSIKLMTAVWEREDLTSTQKLVLLAMADWSNDHGFCWPSVDQLSKKTSMAGRSVQRLIRDLEELGFVRRVELLGKGNQYWISIPLTECHPCTSVTPPLTECHPTPDTVSPNTSYIHQDTPIYTKAARPEGVSQQVWDDWKRIRKKPITPTALKRIETEAAKIGWTLAQAINEASESGWQGFKADWVKVQSNGWTKQKPKDGVSAALDDLLGIAEPSRSPNGRSADQLAGNSPRAIEGPRSM